MVSYRIREALDMRGMDEEQLGAALGRDSEYIERLLMGVEPLAAEDLVCIAEWLDVPAWSLMPDIDLIPGDTARLRGLVECGGRYYRATDTASLRKIADEIDAISEGK